VFLELRYEDVVGDLVGQVRRLLAHCGLDCDDACLTPHRTRRLVRTASASQVREPLYAGAVGRWHGLATLAIPLGRALGLDASPADIGALS